MLASVLQGSVLAPMLSRVFFNGTESGTECTLSTFVHDTKLRGAIPTLEGRNAVRRDLDRHEKWSHVKCRNFKKAKCKVLPAPALGQSSVSVRSGG